MGLKKGTKLAKNPKEFILRVRIDQKTIDMLNTACEQQDKSRSELVREAINKHVKRGKINNDRRTNQTSGDNEESC